MALFFRAGFCARFAAVTLLIAGCSSAKTRTPQRSVIEASRPQAVPVEASSASAEPPPAAVQTARRLPVVQSTSPIEPVAFLSEAELSLPELVREVEARNPSVQAMVYAWQAMAQRYPQAVALDDPMFMAMAAPASFVSNDVSSAYILQGSQKVPWFGKRPARGQAAQAEASAAFHDIDDTRLQVAQVTRAAYFDYYLVHRQSELLDENLRVMREFRDSAQAKYENNLVTQQDVLQADVELTTIERRQLEIERMKRVATSRINTLLRRPPLDRLPPPPRTLAYDEPLPDIAELQQTAALQRPDLAALAARVRGAEWAVTLAMKQYYPDAEFFGRYDSFWQPASTQGDLRGQMGMNVNVPIYRQKLKAAVCEAQFRLSERRAEYQQRQLDIQYDVQAAFEAAQESREAAALYANKFLPFAEQNLELARANYDVDKANFLTLAQAQRQLIEVREKYEQALADYHRRRAELDRATGQSSSDVISDAR
ncbi:MAG TPA: TolC family protein [Pirellulales bacterium]|jgi:cobalt-zinc-cadmium efflux system outer membrane protein|nr:TolC family protein [Pirellulales bacterium]